MNFGFAPARHSEKGPAAAQERFLEFFAATIRNKNTREAYFRAISRFLNWSDERHLEMDDIRPVHVASYIEGFTVGLSDLLGISKTCCHADAL